MTGRTAGGRELPADQTLRGWIEDVISDADKTAERAFEMFDDACRAGLVRAARSIVGNQDDAEDVAQDVLVSLWVARRRLIIEGAIASYLMTAVRNRSLTMLRRRRSIGEPKGFGEVASSATAKFKSANAGPDLALRTSEVDGLFERALAGLPRGRREAIRLQWRGLAPVQIGRFLGITTNAVYIRICRAREDLGPFVERLQEYMKYG